MGDKNPNRNSDYNLQRSTEINREDIHDRKKWRRIVMKIKSNPIGKRTITR